MNYVPIQYLDKSVDFNEMAALYYVANTCVVHNSLRDGGWRPRPRTPCMHSQVAPRVHRCVVTSLRDGMNLVSYEFVACQEANPEKGVLVLSEFAGAAQALGAGCVRVNPFNTEELARSIHEALSMSKEQREELHAYAFQYVTKFTSQAREPRHCRAAAA